MAELNLGKIRFTFKGTYSGGYNYEKDDVVYHDGSTWLMIAAGAQNVEPTPANNAYWSKMSQGSDLGAIQGLAAGDLVYFDGNEFARVPAGADKTALRISNGAPAWQTADYEILNRVRYVYTSGTWTTAGGQWQWVPGLYYDYTPVSSNSVIRAIAGWTAHRQGTYDMITHMEWARSNSDGSSITYLDSFPMADHSATYMSIWHTYQQELSSWGAGTTQRLGLRCYAADYTNYRAVFHETYWNYSPGNGRGSAAYPYWIVEEWSN